MPSVVYSTVSRLTGSLFSFQKISKQSKRFLVSSGVSSAREEFFCRVQIVFFRQEILVRLQWLLIGHFSVTFTHSVF